MLEVFATDRKSWEIAPRSYSFQRICPHVAGLQELANALSVNDTPCVEALDNNLSPVLLGRDRTRNPNNEKLRLFTSGHCDR